jgi:hypothetical protein
MEVKRRITQVGGPRKLQTRIIRAEVAAEAQEAVRDLEANKDLIVWKISGQEVVKASRLKTRQQTVKSSKIRKSKARCRSR